MSLTTILIKNLRVDTVIGVYDFEKQAPQSLRLDLDCAWTRAGRRIAMRLRTLSTTTRSAPPRASSASASATNC